MPIDNIVKDPQGMPIEIGKIDNVSIVKDDYSDLGTETTAPDDYSDLGVEQQAIPEFRNAKPLSVMDKIRSYFRDPDYEIAKAQNVYAISKISGMELKDVYDNYEVLSKTSEITGLTHEIDAKEYFGLATVGTIAAGAVAAPALGTYAAYTATGLVAFAALDKAIPTDEWVKNYEASQGAELPQDMKKAIDLIDFVGKSLIIGGVFKVAPELASRHLQNKIVEYKLPETIKLDKNQVRDIYQTGKLTTAEEKFLLAELNLPREQLKQAISEGIAIEIPLQKITTIVDKPIWAKIKKVFGKQAVNTKTVDTVGKPGKAVSGLIEAKPSEVVPLSKPEQRRNAEADSVLSYVDANGKKVHTTISNNELIYLKDEVAYIPTQEAGKSQLHLDYKTESLKRESTPISREEFISNYPPAKAMLDKVPEFKMPNKEAAVAVQDSEKVDAFLKPEKKIKASTEGAGNFINKAFVPLSTRLSKIDESLRDAIRQHEFSVNMKTKADMEASTPFLKSINKMTADDRLRLDASLKNGYSDVTEGLVKKYGLEKEYKAIQNTLDSIRTRAIDAGMEVGYIEDYFPRRIIDVEKFLTYLHGGENWGAISKALNEERSLLGRPLKEEEKAEIVNKMIRGFGKNKITINKPGNIKERKIIEITPEMNAYYKDSTVALTDYIRSMNDNIEARVFFGKEKNLENSIGNYVSRLVEDSIINPADQAEVQQILKAYFEKRGTRGIISGFKNFSYIASMGSPISAVSQIADLSFSLYKNGLYGTTKAILGKNKLTKQDLGLDIIAEEFTDSSKSSKALSSIFKAVGLEALDAFGKQTLINGAFDRLSNKAIKNNPELIKNLERVFGSKSNDVLLDLKNKVPTDDVKYILFSELADFQPIALSEMPEYYVNGGNLRLFYMLKSYTIKQFDVYHNEIFREKDPVKKMQKAFKLAAALALMGATTDTIKDIILGRKTKFEDMVLDNILKLVGFSKWQLYKTRQDGLFQTMLESILPPAPFVDDIYKDAMRMTNKREKDRPTLDDLRIWQRLPVVGKLYYWWFGGGSELKEKSNKSKTMM